MSRDESQLAIYYFWQCVIVTSKSCILIKVFSNNAADVVVTK